MEDGAPFVFGKIAEAANFTNRKEEIDLLKSNFFNNIHTVLISPRRWGKSSLVAKAAAEAIKENRKLRVCFIDMQNIRTEKEIARYLKKLGNRILTDDGRLALIDLGMVGYLSANMREQLLKLMLAIAEGKGDTAAQVAINMGEVRPQFDEEAYVREVSQLIALHQHATIGQTDIGRIILELTRISGENGVKLPPELTMLGKTLLNIDRVSKTLAPHFDVNESIRENAVSVMRKRMLHQASPTNALSTLLEMNEFMQKLPGRLNKVLDTVLQSLSKMWGTEGWQVLAQGLNFVVGFALAAAILEFLT